MEYVGEVLDADEFETRAVEYARNKIPHFYFMSLKSDYIIDATMRGNISRFINHSCEPNAETQKVTDLVCNRLDFPSPSSFINECFFFSLLLVDCARRSASGIF